MHPTNPYEFDPGSPYENFARQTTFTDFIHAQHENTPRHRQHQKAFRSEGDVSYMTQPSSPEPLNTLSAGHDIYRGGTDRITPSDPARKLRRSSSSEILDYYLDQNNGYPGSDQQRGRKQVHSKSRGRMEIPYGSIEPLSYKTSKDCAGRPSQHASPDVSPSRKNQQWASYYQRFNSPQRTYNERQSDDRDTRGSAHDYHVSNSQGKEFEFASHGHEKGCSDTTTHNDPPKKRSRSPMKKMFGEHGWLGRSPAEAVILTAAQITPSKTKQEVLKKTTVMARLRSKFEELVN